MTVRTEFLEAAFAEAERRYGSFDEYVRQGLGLTDAHVTALRRKYLTAGDL
jgi:protein-tyrosine phosphatase